jgi:hypothetical protein
MLPLPGHPMQTSCDLMHYQIPTSPCTLEKHTGRLVRLYAQCAQPSCLQSNSYLFHIQGIPLYRERAFHLGRVAISDYSATQNLESLLELSIFHLELETRYHNPFPSSFGMQQLFSFHLPYPSLSIIGIECRLIVYNKNKWLFLSLYCIGLFPASIFLKLGKVALILSPHSCMRVAFRRLEYLSHYRHITCIM